MSDRKEIEKKYPDVNFESYILINKRLNEIRDNIVSFHMPGHKYGKVYKITGYDKIMSQIYSTDTTEIPGTDNLHSPEDIIKDAQNKASEIFDSKETRFLVNGSTCGIQARIMAVCKPKDKIIINRDCHQSSINACIMGDINPVYIPASVNDINSIHYGSDEETVIDIIEKNKDAKALLLTYPTYYGKVFNLKRITDYAHKYGITVIVDEAHGAHLGLSDRLPKSAGECGADIAIQSTHKTLPAFTQSSMLHIYTDRVDSDRLSKMLTMTETSSPSYILMQSLEIASDIYLKYGRQLMENLIFNIENSIKQIEKLQEKYNANEKFFKIDCSDDITKIFVSSSEIGITGYEFEKTLRNKHNIQVELSNYYGVLLICTIGNEKKDFDSFADALEKIYLENQNNDIINSIDYPKTENKIVLNPRDAFYSDMESVKLTDSIGRVCAENIVPYPPGICLIAAGEEINRECIEYLIKCRDKGMNISGMKDDNAEYIQVIV